MATPPHQNIDNKLFTKYKRSSNLELYRIIVMLLIVAHHYVVNSGLLDVLSQDPFSSASLAMLIFGAWGKTGINCFILITGYFMCKGVYSLKKLIRLYTQILFYAVIIYSIFLITGHVSFSIKNLIKTLIPVLDLTPSNFVGCFLVFYLFIPFINITINNLTKKQLGLLTVLLVTIYSIFPTLNNRMPVNYIGWFSVLYIISAYIRCYGLPIQLSRKMWGLISLASILISSATIMVYASLYDRGIVLSFQKVYFFVSDSNKLLALLIGVSSFMFFKDLKIPYSRIINLIGGTTFGVLLIHANSDAMRNWLWKETVDCTGNFSIDMIASISYAFVSVVIIFMVCSGIDWFRGQFIEPYILPRIERLVAGTIMSLKNKLNKK